MAKERDLALFVALYESINDALTDLDAVEQLHKDDLIGTFDAAVVDKRHGKSHILKRMDRPMVRIIPEELGFGPLSRKELKAVANELSGAEAALVMLGQPTVENAFDKVVAHATKTLKNIIDATADEIAHEMKEAV